MYVVFQFKSKVLKKEEGKTARELTFVAVCRMS